MASAYPTSLGFLLQNASTLLADSWPVIKKKKNKKQSYCTLSASHVPVRWPGIIQIIQNDCCGPASIIQYLVLYPEAHLNQWDNRKIEYGYTTVTSGTYVRPSHRHYAGKNTGKLFMPPFLGL